MTKPAFHRSPILPRVTTVCLLIMLLLWCGCGKPPALIQKYLFEYPAPVVKTTPLNDNLKVENFTVAQAFNSTAMVYRTSPYKAETYNYSRWRVNPGYLVTDYLIRDLREARLFKAVVPTDSSTKGRFILEGGVEEIQEVDEGDAWKASLGLNITLLDDNEKEIPRRVLFQKSYRAEEPLVEKTPGGLAQAMSRAMAQLSAQIITDISQAAKGAKK